VCLEQKRRPVTVVCLYHINPAATINGYLPAMIAGSAGLSRFARCHGVESQCSANALSSVMFISPSQVYGSSYSAS